jgi:hypothetical protein
VLLDILSRRAVAVRRSPFLPWAERISRIAKARTTEVEVAIGFVIPRDVPRRVG